MVSSALDMSEDELNAVLERLRARSAQDDEYQQVRADLPHEWPL